MWWDHVDKAGRRPAVRPRAEVYLGMCRRWREIPKPTIAMVQGACIAGGLMLAWVCDLIVAADDAFFSDPVVRMGIPGVEYFAHPWVMGPRAAKEFLFTGDRFGAQRAQESGMVNRVVPRADSRRRSMALAEQIAAMPRFGLALTKKAVNQAEDLMGMRSRHGLGLRPAPLRARPQRRGRHRFARRSGRQSDEGRRLGDRETRTKRVDLDFDRRHSGIPDRGPRAGWPRTCPATRCRRWTPRPEVRSPPRSGSDTLADARLSVVSWPRGVRRARRVAARVGALRGGVLPRRARPAGSARTASSCSRPTLFEHGTPEQLDRFLPRDGARRRHLGAGLVGAGGRVSDLAALRSTARRRATAAGC